MNRIIGFNITGKVRRSFDSTADLNGFEFPLIISTTGTGSMFCFDSSPLSTGGSSNHGGHSFTSNLVQNSQWGGDRYTPSPLSSGPTPLLDDPFSNLAVPPMQPPPQPVFSSYQQVS
jgi:hypothetical protein